MATTRRATTVWHGPLMGGSGEVSLDSSGLARFAVDWPARTEQPDGKTSPEELIGAAHSACYSMALSHALAQAGTPAERLETRAEVSFQAGEGITGIHLTVRAAVPGMSPDEFRKAADGAKIGCPVSRALAATPITLDATLET